MTREAALPPVRPPASRRQAVIPMMNKAQVDVAYGFTTITRTDPAYHACLLMNNVLGQYALGGRLGDSIRERQGMAYYVFSAFDANVGEGPLVIRAGVNPANVERTVCVDRRGGPRDDLRRRDRQRARGLSAYLIGSMPRTLETNAGIAAFLHNAEFFGLGLDYDVRLPGALGAVRRDEVNEVARRFLAPESARSRWMVIAGPYEQRRTKTARVTRAVCFDVDFTLIYPGPTFQGEGYRRFCARHGLTVDAAGFEPAVEAASALLDEQPGSRASTRRLFIGYIAAIIEQMGGAGAGLEACAREIYGGVGGQPALLALRRRGAGAARLARAGSASA